MRRAFACLSTLGCAASSALARSGGSLVVGGCLVARHGDMLRLERVSEPGNVQSEWDLARGIAPDYAGTMAAMCRTALDGRVGPQRVLLLGLGGGTMAADLLCGAGRPLDWRLNVTAVEADADVAQAAEQHFFPMMFGAETEARERLNVVVGDAVDLVRSASEERGEAVEASASLGGARFDVVMEDFAYEQPGRLSRRFWADVRALTADDGHLLANTLYARRDEMAVLERELAAAGWKDIRQHVDRGLQAEPGEAWSADKAAWRPRDNMIFEAVA